MKSRESLEEVRLPEISHYYKHKEPNLSSKEWKCVGFSSFGKGVIMECEKPEHFSEIQQFMLYGFFDLYEEVK